MTKLKFVRYCKWSPSPSEPILICAAGTVIELEDKLASEIKEAGYAVDYVENDACQKAIESDSYDNKMIKPEKNKQVFETKRKRGRPPKLKETA